MMVTRSLARGLVAAFLAVTTLSACKTTHSDPGSATLDSQGFGASARGEYQGHGFTASFSADWSTATVRWDDGTPGVTLYRNPNPDPAPRCPCYVYEGPGGRGLYAEFGQGNEIVMVTYFRNPDQGSSGGARTARGEYQGHGFTASFASDWSTATVTWDDGTQGVTLRRNPNPNPAPRCPCYVYEGPGGRGLYAEFGQGNEIVMVTYFRNEDQGSSGGGRTARGNYQGYGFTATFSSDWSTVRISWDDGSPGVTLRHNPNPNPAPRCPCNVYEGEGGRRLIAEFGQGHEIMQVTYSRVGVRGTWRNIGFLVTFNQDRSVATINWDDGDQPISLRYNPNPNPAPRCPCWTYEAPGNRRLYIELGEDGQPMNAIYERN